MKNFFNLFFFIFACKLSISAQPFKNESRIPITTSIYLYRDTIKNFADEPLLNFNELNGVYRLKIKYYDKWFEGYFNIPFSPHKDSLILNYYDKSILEDGEPKQIITAEQLALSGKNTLEEALVYVLPSFFASWQIMADKSEFLTPTSLKGMGPDQFLVLINGKRRHASALLHVNGTFGRGTVSHDLVNVPIGAVQEIEIKSAAASVWHGTDAIAGIINIKLHDNNSPNAQSTIGLTAGYYVDNGLGMNHWWKERNYGNEREGKIYFNTFHTFGKNQQAFLNISGEMLHLGHINRSGDYKGDVYKKEDAATITRRDPFWNHTDYQGYKVLMTGRAQIQQTAAYFNSEIPISIGTTEKMFLYAFGGASYKKGDVVGFYRFPKDSAKMADTLKYGYQPHLEPTIGDYFMTAGLKCNLNIGDKSYGKLDIAQSTGSSTIHNYLFGSLNADLGNKSPRDFYTGGNSYRQTTTDIQLEQLLPITDSSLKALTLNNFHLRAGLVRRSEVYNIVSGDEASYYYNNVVDMTESGSQKLSGFDKSDEIERSRTNYGIFAQTKLTFHQDKWVEHLTLGGRYETFDKERYDRRDEIPRFIRKISGAAIYSDPTKVTLELRSSWNEGFRTPSLHQLYFSGISSQYRGVDPYLVYIAKNESLLAQDFGVKPLKPEMASCFNAGFTMQHPNAKWKIQADYSKTDVKDRIILSGFFDVDTAATAPTSIASILFKREATLKLRSVSSALFFINYPSSVTHNVDVNWSYKFSNFQVQVGFNWNQTRISGDTNKLSAQLRPLESNFFGREERSRYEEVIPAGKVFGVIWGHLGKNKAWNYKLQGTRFGRNAYIHPVQADNFDQVFDNKELIMDLELGYDFKSSGFHITGGVQNIGNFKSNQIKPNPNRQHEEDVTVYGAFQYSRRVQTYGVGGAFLYVKMRYDIGQKTTKP